MKVDLISKCLLLKAGGNAIPRLALYSSATKSTGILGASLFNDGDQKYRKIRRFKKLNVSRDRKSQELDTMIKAKHQVGKKEQGEQISAAASSPLLESSKFDLSLNDLKELCTWISERPRIMEEQIKANQSQNKQASWIRSGKKLKEILRTLEAVLELPSLSSGDETALKQLLLPIPEEENAKLSGANSEVKSEAESSLSILEDILSDPNSVTSLQNTVTQLLDVIQNQREESRNFNISNYAEKRLFNLIQKTGKLSSSSSFMVNPEEMWNLIMRMNKVYGIPLHVDWINITMKYFNDSKSVENFSKCEELLTLDPNLAPTSETFLEILRCQVLKGEFKLVDKYLTKMSELKIPVDPYLSLKLLEEYFSKISALISSGEWERNRSIAGKSHYFQVSTANSTTNCKVLVEKIPELVNSDEMAIHRTFYQLSKLYQENGSGQGGKSELTSKHFKKVYLPIECYEVVMEACALQQMAERSLKYYREYLSAGYTPTKRVFMAILSTLSSRRDFFNEFWVVIEQMETAGMLNSSSSLSGIDSTPSLDVETAAEVLELEVKASSLYGNVSSCLTLFHQYTAMTSRALEEEKNIQFCASPLNSFLYLCAMKSIRNSKYYFTTKMSELKERWKHIYDIEMDLKNNYFNLAEKRELVSAKPVIEEADLSKVNNPVQEVQGDDSVKEVSGNDLVKQVPEGDSVIEDEPVLDLTPEKSPPIKLSLPPVKKTTANEYIPYRYFTWKLRHWNLDPRNFEETGYTEDRKENIVARARRKLLKLSKIARETGDKSVLDNIVSLNPVIKLPPRVRRKADGTLEKVPYEETDLTEHIKNYHRRVLQEEADRLYEVAEKLRIRKELFSKTILPFSKLLGDSFNPEIFELGFRVDNNLNNTKEDEIKPLVLVTNDDLRVFHSWEEVKKRITGNSPEAYLKLADSLWESFSSEGLEHTGEFIDAYLAIYCAFCPDFEAIKKIFNTHYEAYGCKKGLYPISLVLKYCEERYPCKAFAFAQEVFEEMKSRDGEFKPTEKNSLLPKCYASFINILTENESFEEAKELVLSKCKEKGILLEYSLIRPFMKRLIEAEPKYERFSIDTYRAADDIIEKDSSSMTESLSNFLPVLQKDFGTTGKTSSAESLRRNNRVNRVLEQIYGPVTTGGRRQFLDQEKKLKRYDRTARDSDESIRCYRHSF